MSLSIDPAQGAVQKLEGPGYGDNVQQSREERIQRIIKENGFEYRNETDITDLFFQYIARPQWHQNENLEALLSSNAIWKVKISDIKIGFDRSVEYGNTEALRMIWQSRRHDDILGKSISAGKYILHNAKIRQEIRSILGKSFNSSSVYLAAVNYNAPDVRQEIPISSVSNKTLGEAAKKAIKNDNITVLQEIPKSRLSNEALGEVLKKAAKRGYITVLQDILGDTERNIPNGFLVAPYIRAAEHGFVDCMRIIMEHPGFIDAIPIAQNPREPYCYECRVSCEWDDDYYKPFFHHDEDGLPEALLAATYHMQRDALQLILECERAHELSPAYIKFALELAKGNCRRLLQDRFPSRCVIL